MNREELQKKIEELITAVESNVTKENREEMIRGIFSEDISSHKCDRLANCLRELKQSQLNNAMLGVVPSMEVFAKKFDDKFNATIDEVERILASED